MVNMNKEEFVEALKKLNINITEKQLNQLEKFYNILIKFVFLSILIVQMKVCTILCQSIDF